jgi:hypothetical protein
MYDRTAYHHLGDIPRDRNADWERGELQKLVAKKTISTFSPIGVKSGSDEEVFLLDAIRFLSGEVKWGTETHLIAPIGWPPKGGGAAPQGQIVFRIDSKGAASAELIARGPVTAVSQTSFADGEDKLLKFGFASVTGWTGTKPSDAAEISDVAAAMDLLETRAPQDKAALKGVDLIRVPSLGGNEAGEFSTNDDAPGKRPWLKLADKAFNQVQFFGGVPGSPAVPASFQMILHEVGHAVDTERVRQGRQEDYQASADVDQAKAKLTADDEQFKDDLAKATTTKERNAIIAKQTVRHPKDEKAEEAAATHSVQAREKLSQTKVPASVVQAAESDASASGTVAASLLSDGKNAVQALPADQAKGAAAYVQAIDESAAAITQFKQEVKGGTKPIEELLKFVFPKIEARKNAGEELKKAGHTPDSVIEALHNAAGAQDAWFQAERIAANAPFRSRRLEKFIELVKKNNIRRFTQYSEVSWPEHPEEFYAEAYSLWLTDKTFVETNYPAVFEFFASGEYRKDP